MARTAIGVLLSLAGAAGGAVIGVAICRWLYHQGLYAMILPGACLGLGAHLTSLDRSTIRGVVLGLAALVGGFVAEWWIRPFLADESFAYFLRHLSDLLPWTYLMIGLGAAFAFWWGREASPWAGSLNQTIQVKHRVERDQD
jgi:hypothetical protein